MSETLCQEIGRHLLALRSQGQEHHGHQTLKLSIYVVPLHGCFITFWII